MTITRETVAQKLAAYLHHELPLAALVDWAETAMMDGEIDERHFGEIRDVLARLGVADVRAFGLALEDCGQMLECLGYSLRVDVVAA
jgi:hypothetical protein